MMNIFKSRLFLAIGVLALQLSSSRVQAQPGTVVARIDFGGPGTTNYAPWDPTQIVTDGFVNAAPRTTEVAGAIPGGAEVDGPAYASHLWLSGGEFFSYSVGGLDCAKKYDVRLGFSECCTGGTRTFDVGIEGGTNVIAFNPYIAAGNMFNTASELYFPDIDPTGITGQITVTATRGAFNVENPELNVLEITESSTTGSGIPCDSSAPSESAAPSGSIFPSQSPSGSISPSDFPSNEPSENPSVSLVPTPGSGPSILAISFGGQTSSNYQAYDPSKVFVSCIGSTCTSQQAPQTGDTITGTIPDDPGDSPAYASHMWLQGGSTGSSVGYYIDGLDCSKAYNLRLGFAEDIFPRSFREFDVRITAGSGVTGETAVNVYDEVGFDRAYNLYFYKIQPDPTTATPGRITIELIRRALNQQNPFIAVLEVSEALNGGSGVACPSEVPSLTPSESDVPSDSPSDSIMPSGSISPSDVPSDSPSESIMPSDSIAPSDVPSDVPSDNPSDSPSVSQVPTCDNGSSDAGCGGDPHFRTFNGGKRYSWHGEGDMKLLGNSMFRDKLGLDIHGRTTIIQNKQAYYSIIEAVAIRIGKFILEVSPDYYFVNGEENAELPITVYGNIRITKYVEEIQHLHRTVYELDLAQDGIIKFTTFKNYVLVNIIDANEAQFSQSLGMLGTYYEGTLVARDGVTVIQDYDTLGDHWQVLRTEHQLFQHLRAPQHPFEKPRMPPKDTHEGRRRLGATHHVDIAEAEEACFHRIQDNEECIFDVLATGDLDLAIGGEF